MRRSGSPGWPELGVALWRFGADRQIFTGKKLEDISPSTHNMDVPHVRRTEYTLLNIEEGEYLSLMTDNDSKDDVKLPENDLGNEIQAAFEDGKDIMITILTAMGEEAPIS
jgi:translation initiation factor 5A